MREKSKLCLCAAPPCGKMCGLIYKKIFLKHERQDNASWIDIITVLILYNSGILSQNYIKSIHLNSFFYILGRQTVDRIVSPQRSVSLYLIFFFFSMN